LPTRVLESGGQRRLVAEVARQVDHAQPWVGAASVSSFSGVLSLEPSLTMINS
jgi:hypothetical protein